MASTAIRGLAFNSPHNAFVNFILGMRKTFVCRSPNPDVQFGLIPLYIRSKRTNPPEHVADKANFQHMLRGGAVSLWTQNWSASAHKAEEASKRVFSHTPNGTMDVLMRPAL